MSKTKISACIVTYNQQKFIRECLQGVVNQKLSYDFEIVIGQDNSTDETHNICLEYSTRYPNLIKYFPRDKNLGMIGNWTKTLEQCTGNYIAMCEGDDYWTDPYKLQKQVDFLEANPDYVLNFHKVKILKPDGLLVDDFITKVPDNYETQETLARLGNYIHTPSVVFRNLIIELPKEFSLSPIGDYFLYMLLSERGKIKYIEDEMAVYRYGVGVISTMNNFMIASNNVKMYSCMISCIKDVDVKSILMKRQEMIISQYGKSFELKDSIILKLPKILIYVKDKSLELIYNPKRALMKIKNKVLKKIKN